MSSVVQLKKVVAQQMTGDSNTIQEIKIFKENYDDYANNNTHLNLDEKYQIKYMKNPKGGLNKQILVITLTGNEDSALYQNRFLKFEIRFYDGFPQLKPQIYFQPLSNNQNILEKLEHLNIYETGLLCIPQINDKWQVNTTLQDILKMVDYILHDPNQYDAANSQLLSKNNEDRFKIQMRQRDFMIKERN